jgi:protein-disulfide isomerase
MEIKTIIFILIVIILIACYINTTETFSHSSLDTSLKNSLKDSLETSLETSSNKSVDILLFLSTTCPHCVTFKENDLPGLKKKFANTDYNLKVIMGNEDSKGLFNKYQIQFIPACIVVKDEKFRQLKGKITYDNIMKEINLLSNSPNLLSVIPEQNHEFEILVFLSKTCPHCVTYLQNKLSELERKIENTNYTLTVIMSDEDGDGLFDKYKVQYVPACVVTNGNRYKQLEGEIIYENIQNIIDEANNA